MRVHLFDIKWHSIKASDQIDPKDLPKETELDVLDADVDNLFDALSDAFGWDAISFEMDFNVTQD